jgi:Protein of unknown function (DUF3574)
MRMNRTVVAALVFALGLAAGGGLTTVIAQKRTTPGECGASTAAQVRTTLYFGSARPKGSVSELEWQLFLRDEVTSRFPDGLTVWDAEGQWRAPQGSIEHERTKVLLLVHADTQAARDAVLAVIERYRKAFDQQSVLWETSRVCVAS